MELGLIFIIFLTGVFSGFVDAIAGGGGLIMLPGLMLSGLPVGAAIATNKLCGTFGALTSSLKFAHAKKVDWRACTYMGAPAVFGSLLGSRSIGFLPKTWAEPVVIVLMIAITLFVLLKPQFGMEVALASPTMTESSWLQIAKLAVSGFVIGFHDGFFGPGTGTFLVFVLLSVWSLDFLHGTGSAKVINLMTNVTALVSFLWIGAIDFPKGSVGAVGMVVGAYGGATFATRKGAQLIKPVFVLVTFTLVGKLLLDYFSR